MTTWVFDKNAPNPKITRLPEKARPEPKSDVIRGWAELDNQLRTIIENVNKQRN